MKLRIKANSVRLRLSQTEVRRLSADGGIWETTQFDDDTSLEYSVYVDADASRMSASFDGRRLSVTLPAGVAYEWAGSDQVSLLGEQPVTGGVLKILVEKDFQCLVPREDEDESDLFPNPRAEE